VRYFSKSVGEREDAMEADKYEVLSFDCYGTLVDWESGIISGLRPVLRSHGVEATDDEILDLHAGSGVSTRAPRRSRRSPTPCATGSHSPTR
jgi:hypothetical protein